VTATILTLPQRPAVRPVAASRVFRPSNWPQDDYRMLHKHLSSLAVMIGGGSLVDPLAIAELLARYSANASDAAKNADALLTRASMAERKVRRLERAAKRKG